MTLLPDNMTPTQLLVTWCALTPLIMYVFARAVSAALIRFQIGIVDPVGRRAFSHALSVSWAASTTLLAIACSLTVATFHISTHTLNLSKLGTAGAFLALLVLLHFIGGHLQRRIDRWAGVTSGSVLSGGLRAAYREFVRNHVSATRTGTQSPR